MGGFFGGGGSSGGGSSTPAVHVVALDFPSGGVAIEASQSSQLLATYNIPAAASAKGYRLTALIQCYDQLGQQESISVSWEDASSNILASISVFAPFKNGPTFIGGGNTLAHIFGSGGNASCGHITAGPLPPNDGGLATPLQTLSNAQGQGTFIITDALTLTLSIETGSSANGFYAGSVLEILQ